MEIWTVFSPRLETRWFEQQMIDPMAWLDAEAPPVQAAEPSPWDAAGQALPWPPAAQSVFSPAATEPVLSPADALQDHLLDLPSESFGVCLRPPCGTSLDCVAMERPRSGRGHSRGFD